MQKESNFKKGIRGINRHLGSFKKEIIIISALGIVSSIANGFVPYISGRFFDSLINLSDGVTSMGLPLWTSLLIIWAVIQLVANNVDWIIDRLTRYTDTKMHLNIQTLGFIHLLKLPVEFHKNEHIQESIQKISMAGWRIPAILRNISQIAPQLLSVLIGLILSLTINVNLALILVFGVFIYVILLLKILPPLAKADEATHRLWEESWDLAASSVNQIDSVKQASSEEYESKNMKENFLIKTFGPWIKMELIWSNVNFFQRIIVFVTQLSVFVLSVHLIGSGVITVGELIAVNGYSVMFFGPFVTLGHSWQVFQNGLTSAASAEELFEKETEIYTPLNAVSQEISGGVQFEDVTFGYETEGDVLSDINVEVRKGESIALVGESGSGKSTLISLISAYYFPQKGRVLIDGIDTSKYDLLSLRKQIAVVPQEIALFNDTIENNIKYGNFDAKFEDIKNVARESHLEEFIEGLSNGYKTLVGERGVKLSVGQKQRLAIARAMLRNPKILILDEPTSALDSMTEKFITESLEKLMKDRTTFIIAHRLSTVRKANRIFVFDKGKIIESGTHAELLKIKDGFYKKLHDYQIGVY
ncbi:ABC transporter ATP-binding protein [Candidatus Kaiserbacteria bacterium]|nr:ABC transporter ATP-binding protein [Candidatus Kaiserbacteria bacterium]